jgi:hypothetical protein
MMTAKQLNEACDLMKQIGACKCFIAEYSKGRDVIVSLPMEQPQGMCRAQHEVTLRHAEIGGAIVAALTARLTALQADLRALGVDPDTTVA